MDLTRFDDLLLEAGSRVDAPGTRRGFLGRAGAGFAALGAATLFGELPEAMAASAPERCFGTIDTNIAWYPFRVLGEDLPLKKGPTNNTATVQRKDGTNTPIIARKGRLVALQSTRNPDCDTKNPPLRPQATGTDGSGKWAWIYPSGSETGQDRRQGWILVAKPDGTPTVTPAYDVNDPDANFDEIRQICGPAGADRDGRNYFRKGRCKVGKNRRGQCYGSGVGSVQSLGNLSRRDMTADSTLRYAPGSSVAHWVREGNRVDPLCRKDGWVCVEVVESGTAPVGFRGWVSRGAISLT